MLEPVPKTREEVQKQSDIKENKSIMLAWEEIEMSVSCEIYRYLQQFNLKKVKRLWESLDIVKGVLKNIDVI